MENRERALREALAKWKGTASHNRSVQARNRAPEKEQYWAGVQDTCLRAETLLSEIEKAQPGKARAAIEGNEPVELRREMEEFVKMWKSEGNRRATNGQAIALVNLFVQRFDAVLGRTPARVGEGRDSPKPFRHERESQGCTTCGHGDEWTVIYKRPDNGEDEGWSETWSNECPAEEMAESLNLAFKRGWAAALRGQS